MRSDATCWGLISSPQSTIARSMVNARLVSAVQELVMFPQPNPMKSSGVGLLSGGTFLRSNHVLMLSRMSRVACVRSRDLPMRSRQRGPTSCASL